MADNEPAEKYDPIQDDQNFVVEITEIVTRRFFVRSDSQSDNLSDRMDDAEAKARALAGESWETGENVGGEVTCVRIITADRWVRDGTRSDLES